MVLLRHFFMYDMKANYTIVNSEASNLVTERGPIPLFLFEFCFGRLRFPY